VLERAQVLEQRSPEILVDERLVGGVALARGAAADARRHHRREQSPDRPLDVADELDLGLVEGVHLGWLCVDVDDPLAAVGVPAGRAVLDEVVADGHHEVRPVEPRQDVVARLEPDRHQREVAPVVDGALAHERGRDRHVKSLGKGADLVRGVPAEDAVAGQHEGSRRGRQKPSGVLDGFIRRFREVGVCRLDGPEFRLDRCRRKVLGELDMGRARLLELGDAERLAHDLGNGAGLLHALVPLGHGLEHPHDVDVLVRLLVELVETGLAGDGDHRRVVEECVGDAGDQVGGAGPERRHGDRGASGQPPVDVGHERGALFVAGRDVSDTALATERVEDIHRLLAGDREDVPAALGDEALDEEVGGSPLRRIGLWWHAPSVRWVRGWRGDSR
jgi:hypothetical protein